MHDCTNGRDPLLLATGKPIRVVIRTVCHVHSLEQLSTPFAGRSLASAEKLGFGRLALPPWRSREGPFFTIGLPRSGQEVVFEEFGPNERSCKHMRTRSHVGSDTATHARGRTAPTLVGFRHL